MAWAYLIPLAMQLLQSDQQNNGGSQNTFSVPFGQGGASPYNYYNGGDHPGMLGAGAPGGGGGGGMGATGGGGLGASAGGAGGGGSGFWGSFMSNLGSSGGGGGGLMSSLQSQTPAGRMSNIANGIFNMFFAKNPSDAARPDLQAIEPSMLKYLQPYMDAGMKALPTLQDQYSQLANNPGAVMSKIGSGFQQSPGYQFQVDQATNAANRAAAAGGMLGSPMAQQNTANVVNQLANQDYYNYLDHGIGLYGSGLSGLSNLYGTGFNASGMMSNGVMQALMAMAQNDYAGANTYNQQMGGGISSMIGGMF